MAQGAGGRENTAQLLRTAEELVEDAGDNLALSFGRLAEMLKPSGEKAS